MKIAFNAYSKIRWLLVAGISLLPVGLVWGENLVPSGNFDEADEGNRWTSAHVGNQTFEECVTGGASFRFQHCGWVTSPELVEIDPHKNYVLRLFVKVPSEKQQAENLPVELAIGLRFYNEQGEAFSPLAVAAIPNTATVLAGDASKGDKVIRLHGSKWEDVPKGATAIAFGAEEDFSDLPNDRTANIELITAADPGFEVHLYKPLERDYSAGTPVRQHRYADFPTVSAEPGEEWAEHVLEIGGVSEPGVVEKGKFWHGVRHVRPSIGAAIRDAATMASDKPIEVLIDDVTFTQVE